MPVVAPFTWPNYRNIGFRTVAVDYRIVLNFDRLAEFSQDFALTVGELKAVNK